MYFTTSAPNFLWGGCFQFFTKNRPQKHQKRAIFQTSQANGGGSSPLLATLLNLSRESMPVITYIGGYCCFSIFKKLKCEECKQLIVSNHGKENSFNNSLIKGINTGSLLYPSSDIVHVALVSYIVFQKIIGSEEFLRSSCQRALTMNSILAALDDELLELDFANECNSKHEPVKLVKIAVYTCTNVIRNE